MMLFVGAGAVGTVLAGYALGAGRLPVRLYARDKDLARLQTIDQLRVDTVLPGLPPLRHPKPALTTSLDLSGVEYLVIGVKYPQLADLLDQLPTIPETCTLVSTLNGVNGLRLIRERLPQARVVPMSVMFNAQLLAPLHARITTRPQALIGSDDQRLLKAFRGSGLQIRRAQGESAVWGKLLINLANALCAVTHTTFKDLLTHPDLRAAYIGVLDEAATVLAAAGIHYRLPMPVGPRGYRLLLRHGGPLAWWVAKLRNGLREGAYPSMVADVLQGRTTEVAQLNGEIVSLGHQYGHSTPANARLVALVEQLSGTPPVFLSPQALREQLGLPPL